MYIDKNKKRFNPYATHVVDGVVFPGNILSFPYALEDLFVMQVPEPEAPEDYSEDTYFRMEVDEAPYVVYEKKSDEMIAKQAQIKINAESRAYLLATDWYTLRQVETGEAVPEDILTARQAARDAVVHVDEEV